MGYFRRVSAWTMSSSAAPFGHSVPRLVGWSTSPSMWMMSACSPFARLPLEYMMMPQATEQYVQVLRVSVVPTSLKGRIAAAYAASTPPNPSAPMVVPARPALAPAMNWRRESSIFKVVSSDFLPPTGDTPATLYRPIESADECYAYQRVEAYF